MASRFQLSRSFEPTITRNGYDVLTFIVLIHVEPAEVGNFMARTLKEDRCHEFTGKPCVAGLPLRT